jgi:hypothetical protein
MKDPSFLIVPLVLLFVVAFWCGLLALIGWAGGWAGLAKEYWFRDQFDGFRRRFASGAMNGGPLLGFPCNYGLCLTLGSNQQGMYLAVFGPFRPGHPPLFIPWSDVSAKPTKGWLNTYTDFTFAKCSRVQLRIDYRLAKELISAAGDADKKAIDLA